MKKRIIVGIILFVFILNILPGFISAQGNDPYFGYCPTGYTFNTRTGQCERSTGQCPPGQIYNSLTGQCETKTCPQGTVLNPATGECETQEINCYGTYYQCSDYHTKTTMDVNKGIIIPDPTEYSYIKFYKDSKFDYKYDECWNINGIDYQGRAICQSVYDGFYQAVTGSGLTCNDNSDVNKWEKFVSCPTGTYQYCTNGKCGSTKSTVSGGDYSITVIPSATDPLKDYIGIRFRCQNSQTYYVLKTMNNKCYKGTDLKVYANKYCQQNCPYGTDQQNGQRCVMVEETVSTTGPTFFTGSCGGTGTCPNPVGSAPTCSSGSATWDTTICAWKCGSGSCTPGSNTIKPNCLIGSPYWDSNTCSWKCPGSCPAPDCVGKVNTNQKDSDNCDIYRCPSCGDKICDSTESSSSCSSDCGSACVQGGTKPTCSSGTATWDTKLCAYKCGTGTCSPTTGAFNCLTGSKYWDSSACKWKCTGSSDDDNCPTTCPDISLPNCGGDDVIYDTDECGCTTASCPDDDNGDNQCTDAEFNNVIDCGDNFPEWTDYPDCSWSCPSDDGTDDDNSWNDEWTWDEETDDGDYLLTCIANSDGECCDPLVVSVYDEDDALAFFDPNNYCATVIVMASDLGETGDSGDGTYANLKGLLPWA